MGPGPRPGTGLPRNRACNQARASGLSSRQVHARARVRHPTLAAPRCSASLQLLLRKKILNPDVSAIEHNPCVPRGRGRREAQATARRAALTMQPFDDESSGGPPIAAAGRTAYGAVQHGQRDRAGKRCGRLLLLAKVVVSAALVIGGVATIMFGFLDALRALAPSGSAAAGNTASDANGTRRPRPSSPSLSPVDLAGFPDDVIASLNTSADPCSDFYEFACGGWKPAVPIPSYMSEWDKQWHSVIGHVEEATIQILQGDDGPAGKFYHACMDESRIDTLKASPILPLLRSLVAVSLASINAIQ